MCTMYNTTNYLNTMVRLQKHFKREGMAREREEKL